MFQRFMKSKGKDLHVTRFSGTSTKYQLTSSPINELEGFLSVVESQYIQVRCRATEEAYLEALSCQQVKLHGNDLLQTSKL